MAKSIKPEPLASRILAARRKAGLLEQPDEIKANYGRGLSSGLELAVAVFVCALGGYGLDRWLESKPWFMLLGLVVGLVVGVWNLHRAALGADALDIGVKPPHKK